MFPLLMRHPQHGAMHAYDEAERTRLEGYGWKADEPPVEPPVAVVEAPKKRGRPRKAEA